MPKRPALTALCTCDLIPRLAREPDVPIVFDDAMHEFHLVFGHESRSRATIYHCFSCGGAMPKSRREEHFATITDTETIRLKALTKAIRSLEDAIKQFGPPDHDLPDGETVVSPGSGGEPDHVRTYRTLLYSRLSETAEVVITDYAPRGIGVEYRGKYLGDNR
jgi:hypothetical protein